MGAAVGLKAGESKYDSRPGIAAPDPCGLCGLFHPESVHSSPASRFVGPGHCGDCAVDRCAAPNDCLNPHAGESAADHKLRLLGL